MHQKNQDTHLRGENIIGMVHTVQRFLNIALNYIYMHRPVCRKEDADAMSQINFLLSAAALTSIGGLDGF